MLKGACALLALQIFFVHGLVLNVKLDPSEDDWVSSATPFAFSQYSSFSANYTGHFAVVLCPFDTAVKVRREQGMTERCSSEHWAQWNCVMECSSPYSKLTEKTSLSCQFSLDTTTLMAPIIILCERPANRTCPSNSTASCLRDTMFDGMLRYTTEGSQLDSARRPLILLFSFFAVLSASNVIVYLYYSKREEKEWEWEILFLGLIPLTVSLLMRAIATRILVSSPVSVSWFGFKMAAKYCAAGWPVLHIASVAGLWKYPYFTNCCAVLLALIHPLILSRTEPEHMRIAVSVITLVLLIPLYYACVSVLLNDSSRVYYYLVELRSEYVHVGRSGRVMFVLTSVLYSILIFIPLPLRCMLALFMYEHWLYYEWVYVFIECSIFLLPLLIWISAQMLLTRDPYIIFNDDMIGLTSEEDVIVDKTREGERN